eukprot:CAMPEP_0168323126 /NCGR_PEP_ID=MMETSP0213-20121227/3305_1 /TAXON_ID=151035 /ORGANISM="Euplotes harpa, Strain FSP1.4" /LENGTH=98 /DNA_ID=CAMNT_0008325157 /DNA_START=3 /DNA_END=295 /DNA_ORIENTATION=+
MSRYLEELQEQEFTEKPKPESAAKLMKTVETLTQKNKKLEEENAKFMTKIEALRRNFEGLSNSSKNEKDDYLRLKRQNEQYDKELNALRVNNEELARR